MSRMKKYFAVTGIKLHDPTATRREDLPPPLVEVPHSRGKEDQIFSRMASWHFCKFVTFVPIVVLGRSYEAHLVSPAEDSMESTKESLPDEEETTKASRDRLQVLPEWLQEFAETGGD